ncbi:MAG: type II secretion system protein GspG [Lentisphaerae bacterium]|nr:type II secretion system protein GspG [Lentisphaerota bacterium]
MINPYPSVPVAAMRRHAGFTLLEIMVVVGIVGMLSAIASVYFAKSRADARLEKARADVEMLHAAIHQLAQDTGRFPGAIPRNTIGDVETMDLAAPSAGLLKTNGNFPNWRGPYLNNLSRDPWGNRYFFDPDYWFDGAYHSVIGSFGPNGIGRNVYDNDNIYRAFN